MVCVPGDCKLEPSNGEIQPPRETGSAGGRSKSQFLPTAVVVSEAEPQTIAEIKFGANGKVPQ